MEESEETVTETEDASLEEGGMYKKDDKMEETVDENIDENIDETVEENIEETTELTEAETVNVDVVELVDSILSAVSDATGVEMSREGGEEELGAEEGEPELGDEPEPGDEPVEDPELGGEELPAEEPAPEEEEEDMDTMMQEKFINEVTRRVAKRLLEKLGKS